jgi:hypothetical protein
MELGRPVEASALHDLEVKVKWIVEQTEDLCILVFWYRESSIYSIKDPKAKKLEQQE